MKAVVFGANGMLGHTLIRYMSKTGYFNELVGTVRNASERIHFCDLPTVQIVSGVSAINFKTVTEVLENIRPDVVINAIGIIKQTNESLVPLSVLPINSIFPHKLAHFCSLIGSRLVHISTDCVFKGDKGLYSEMDQPDADDLYGVSKHLGEVYNGNHITIRTSIIGHEISGRSSLLSWFLSQKNKVNGYQNAIFSGVPTIELSNIICDYVLQDPRLKGLYHVAAEPIDKFSLLSLIAQIYEKKIEIDPVDYPKVDRSLNAAQFNSCTGYTPKAWPELIKKMKLFG